MCVLVRIGVLFVLFFGWKCWVIREGFEGEGGEGGGGGIVLRIPNRRSFYTRFICRGVWPLGHVIIFPFHLM